MKTLLLKKEEVRNLINMKDVMEAVEEGYMAFNEGKVIQPDYMTVDQPAPRGEIDFKIAYYQTKEVMSLKASSGGFSENPTKYGLPTNIGTILLWDGRTCALICVMDGSLITGLRTGAAGAVSVKLLARKNAKRITSIGTGRQARMQIRAISQVMKINDIYAWDSNPDALAKYKAEIEAEFGIPVKTCLSKKEAVENADILITTTCGQGPLVEADWVKPGTHIVAIGTDQRGKQELEPEVFRNAKIVNDSIEQCTQKGETWHPLNSGIITREDIHGEIGELFLGRKPGRENDQEITIFDATGMAIQDTATANRIYLNAIEKNMGIYFEFAVD